MKKQKPAPKKKSEKTTAVERSGPVLMSDRLRELREERARERGDK